MAVKTGISWTDSTFNPWIGCTKVSPGCDHCYAEVSAPARVHHIVWGSTATRQRTSANNWKLPLRWNRESADFIEVNGHRQRVFCASLSDVFDNQVDPTWRADLWALIRATPNLDWLLLTKRVGNIKAMLPDDWGDGYPNVWLGISVVNQEEANRDIPKLLSIPSRIHWLSMEPLLGKVILPDLRKGQKLDWIVVGGESGPHARPMEAAWAESLAHQCIKREIHFFFKQWGGNEKDKGGCKLKGWIMKSWPKSFAT